MLRKIIAVATAAAAFLVPAGPALADSQDGIPETEEYVQWMYEDYSGPIFDQWQGDLSNYMGAYFVNTRVLVDQNTSSVKNLHPRMYVRAFTGQNYTGASMTLLPFDRAENGMSWRYPSLGSFDNSFRSHRFDWAK
ncbi:hypothetical protein [Actinoplanes subglobosus]|uniref:Uncharacterized protein n=1 Tax=Actinoplanes subglobosus TaxID=1547892 RepID=A0ABV8IU05_9ACTN